MDKYYFHILFHVVTALSLFYSMRHWREAGAIFLFSFYILTYKNIFCMYSYFTANLNYMSCLHDCTWSMLLGTTSDQNTITGAMFWLLHLMLIVTSDGAYIHIESLAVYHQYGLGYFIQHLGSDSLNKRFRHRLNNTDWKRRAVIYS